MHDGWATLIAATLQIERCREVRLRWMALFRAGEIQGLTYPSCYNRNARRGSSKMTKLGSVVRLLQREHDHLTKQIRGVAAALEAFGAAYGKQNGNRKISSAGRARIAAAQRARWAKVNSNGAQPKNVVTMPKKRKMSPDSRKRIAAAQRARWQKVKAAKKSGKG